MAHIVVNDVTPVDSYTSTSNQSEFTVSFPFFTDASLEVFKTESGNTPNDTTDKLTLGVHYTVTGAGNVEGATKKITLTSGNFGSEGDKIVIRRNEPTSRTSDLQEQGDFLAETFNDEQDKVIMLIQQIEELLGRSIVKGVTGGNWDAQDTTISSVGDPSNGTDAANKNFVASEVASQISAAGALPFTPPEIKKTNFTAQANQSYVLFQTFNTLTITLPETPANGTFIRFYNVLPWTKQVFKTSGNDVIFPTGIRIDEEFTATAYNSGTRTMTDSDRDGSTERKRHFRTNALVGRQLLNVSTGQQANITANTSNTITHASSPALSFSVGNVYRVAYDEFTLDESEVGDNPTPSFISFVYYDTSAVPNNAGGYWSMSTQGDARGILYNTNSEVHLNSNSPSQEDALINQALDVEDAIINLYKDFKQTTNDRIDSNLRFVNLDAASATSDNAHGPVFTHYMLTADRVITLNQHTGTGHGVSYHVINGTHTGTHKLTLTAGTNITHITLIKSGSVTRSSASVDIPKGSSCKVRPISSTEWIVYDADSAVVKV